MPEIARTAVGLRIFGDDLDPVEITRLMGVEPTACARKGDADRIRSGRDLVARSGSWRLALDASAPGNLNAQISAILAKLPDDLSVWRELSRRYRCDIFCGLFMHDGNEGAELQPDVLAMLGDRGLRLGLDIYNASD